MAESTQRPLIRSGDDVEMEAVDAGEGMSKSVLVGPKHGAPNFAMRRFELAPGAHVPKHTNEVEHEQYVLSGEYTVGFVEDGEENEYTVTAGDSLLIPAGVVHWYRNDNDESGSFICAVPNGDDTIQVLDDE